MAGIQEYLDLTTEQARAQWRSILARQPRPALTGFRQVHFTPVETLLCLAAMPVIDHHRFGGSTSDLAPTPVPEMAALFERTAASILAKQANLDGSRPNGARHEVETAQVLLGHPDHLVATYRVIFEAARAEQIAADRLPDFLELESGRRFDLLGQDELTSEDVEAAVEPQMERLAGRMGGVPDAVTERLLVAVARVGQHRFAAQVIVNFAHSCGFCGMKPGPELERRGLLVASHIKPWRASTNRERLDPANGIAACPTHDAAFDGGLIWVNGGYRIHRVERLAMASQGNPGMTASFGYPPLAEALFVATVGVAPARRYLDWHRNHVVRV